MYWKQFLIHEKEISELTLDNGMGCECPKLRWQKRETELLLCI